MSFFAGIGKKKDIEASRSVLPAMDALKRAAAYAEHLTLPEAVGNVRMCVAGADDAGQSTAERSVVNYRGTLRMMGRTAGKSRKTDTPCSLLFFTDGTDAGSLNAGYMAGQCASFLHFLGMESAVLHTVPEGITETLQEGWQFAAALSLDKKYLEENRRADRSSAVSSCIYTENRENWSDELLTFAKSCYPKSFHRIRASRRENWIHFSMKRTARRHGTEAAFEAGMAAANIMAAAEELWVDLEMIKIDADVQEGYLFSVCRKGAGKAADTEMKLQLFDRKSGQENTALSTSLQVKEQKVSYA